MSPEASVETMILGQPSRQLRACPAVTIDVPPPPPMPIIAGDVVARRDERRERCHHPGHCRARARSTVEDALAPWARDVVAPACRPARSAP